MAGIDWITSYRGGLDETRKTSKFMLVDFYHLQ